MLTWIRDTIINVNIAICTSVARITGTVITIDTILRERERWTSYEINLVL